jgi:hypothetical protein
MMKTWYTIWAVAELIFATVLLIKGDISGARHAVELTTACLILAKLEELDK